MSSSTPSNPARPAPGLRLCALSEIAEPGARGFRFREGPSFFAGFVLRADGQVTGFVDSCPHAGWPLSTLDDRYLTRDGRRILCAGHGALFDLSGLCTVGPCEGDRLTAWPVDVRGGWVVTL